MLRVRDFDFPQGLKPFVDEARSGTAEQAAEKLEEEDPSPTKFGSG
jgi:hypothetical protein